MACSYGNAIPTLPHPPILYTPFSGTGAEQHFNFLWRPICKGCSFESSPLCKHFSCMIDYVICILSRRKFAFPDGIWKMYGPGGGIFLRDQRGLFLHWRRSSSDVEYWKFSCCIVFVLTFMTIGVLELTGKTNRATVFQFYIEGEPCCIDWFIFMEFFQEISH